MNLFRIFFIAYCYIISELTEAFVFMNICIKELFFYGNCRGMIVLLGDFAVGLIIVIVIKRKLFFFEAGFEVTWELIIDINNWGSEVFF